MGPHGAASLQQFGRACYRFTCMTQDLTPDSAVDRLIALHRAATTSLKDGLDRYFDTREAPSETERRGYCYPELRLTYVANGIQPRISRAYAKFQGPGVYTTTV